MRELKEARYICDGPSRGKLLKCTFVLWEDETQITHKLVLRFKQLSKI
jgi:hypothetical protein